jgi:hypothetical protein
MDRHNIEVTHTVFATATTPQLVRQAYIVIRCSPGDDVTAVDQFVAGSTTFFNSSTVRADTLAWLS